MAKHRAGPPVRVRPRVGRLVAASAAVLITGVALLSGIGVLDLSPGAASASAAAKFPGTLSTGGAGSRAAQIHGATPQVPTITPTPAPTPTPAAEETTSTPRTASTALPAASGQGRRIVFSIADQRVWLVDASGSVLSTYLVSGSLSDNLQPGSYHVYSRSRWAVGVDESGVMQYFVRFAHGAHAAIGFHSIPTKGGHPLETDEELGTPQSHGCIRQKLSDAERLWGFAPIGTDVVVTA